jgi:hypothetical protein
MTEYAIIIPEPGKLKETAKALLELAGQPSDVMTDSNGVEFRVPVALAEQYAAVAYAPTPKRRGRPPKIKSEVTE